MRVADAECISGIYLIMKRLLSLRHVYKLLKTAMVIFGIAIFFIFAFLFLSMDYLAEKMITPMWLIAIVIVYIVVRWWRCPQCKRILPVWGMWKSACFYCGHCGNKIDVSWDLNVVPKEKTSHLFICLLQVYSAPEYISYQYKLFKKIRVSILNSCWP